MTLKRKFINEVYEGNYKKYLRERRDDYCSAGMIIAECSTSGPAGLIVSARTGKSVRDNTTEQHFRED